MLRFYLDENLPPQIAPAARRRGLDIVSAQGRGHRRLSDEQQLRLAAEDERCIVTRDSRDFVGATERFEKNGWPHAGVLLVPRSLQDRDVGGIVAALIGFEDQYPDGLPSYAVAYLAAADRR